MDGEEWSNWAGLHKLRNEESAAARQKVQSQVPPARTKRFSHRGRRR